MSTTDEEGTLKQVNELLSAMEIVAEYERGFAHPDIEQSIRVCITLCDLYKMYIVADQYRERLRLYQAGTLKASC